MIYNVQTQNVIKDYCEKWSLLWKCNKFPEPHLSVPMKVPVLQYIIQWKEFNWNSEIYLGVRTCYYELLVRHQLK
jgi:hypothetical protein